MSEDINDVSFLVRREIEALIAVPLIKAYINEFGKEKALKVAQKVIRQLANESGRLMAKFAGGNSISDFQKIQDLFSKGNAFEIDNIEFDGNKASLEVTRCKYAEMIKRLGFDEFGFLILCERDPALFEGFNPDIKFSRTKTIMEGDDCCDFCLEEVKD